MARVSGDSECHHKDTRQQLVIYTKKQAYHDTDTKHQRIRQRVLIVILFSK